jgi:hypothetical protein
MIISSTLDFGSMNGAEGGFVAPPRGGTFRNERARILPLDPVVKKKLYIFTKNCLVRCRIHRFLPVAFHYFKIRARSDPMRARGDL